MFTALVAAATLALGFGPGRKFPSVAATAQAALHFAQAEATAIETHLRAKSAGVTTDPDGPAANAKVG